MARMILAGGYDLAVWARRPEATLAFAEAGARVAASPVELAAASDVLCLCVTGDADVRDLLVEGGVLAAMAPGSIVAQHSTIAPATCVDLAERAARHGLRFLDLPVSGSGHAALARRLLVLCGGEAAALETIRPVLECYAGSILHMGEVGAGQRAKLLNNLLAVVNIGQAWRLLTLAPAVGVDPAAMREAVLAGTARTASMEAMVRLCQPARAAHVLAILRKDVALAFAAFPPDEMAPWRDLASAGLDALATLAASDGSLLG